MQATPTLPAGYTLREKIDANAMLSPAVQLTGIGISVVFGFLFLLCYIWMHPASGEEVTLFAFNGLTDVLLLLVGAIGLTALMIVLHEGIHGLFFWIFTRRRPQFAFKGYYAYAAMPDCYVPRTPYLVVGLAPLVLITIGGLAALALVPGWFIGLWFLLTCNAGGAVGDLYVCRRLLRCPPYALVHDQGTDTEIYLPES